MPANASKMINITLGLMPPKILMLRYAEHSNDWKADCVGGPATINLQHFNATSVCLQELCSHQGRIAGLRLRVKTVPIHAPARASKSHFDPKY